MIYLWLAIAISVFLWVMLLRYYLGLPKYFNRLFQAYDAAKLCPPAWLFLPFIPFWGGEKLVKLLKSPVTIPIFDKIVHVFNHSVQMSSGDFILIEEQFERATGEGKGVKIHVLDKNRSIRFESGPNIAGISVSIARQPHRYIEWAMLSPKPYDDTTFELTNMSNRQPIPLFRRNGIEHEMVDYLDINQPFPLQSGDRFPLGLSEFEFIHLPELALWDESSHQSPYADLYDELRDILNNRKPPVVKLPQGMFCQAALRDEVMSPEDTFLLQPGDIFVGGSKGVRKVVYQA